MKQRTERALPWPAWLSTARWAARLCCIVLVSSGYAFGQQGQDPVGEIANALRSHDFQGALTLSQTALRTHPQDYRLWTLQGMATAGTGKLPVALEDYQHALRLAPTYLPALEGIAQTEVQLGEDARPTLARILAQRPDDPPTEALLGILNYRSDDCAAAVESFRKAAAAISRNPEALNDEGACFSALKQYGEAVDAFSSALRLDSASSIARYNLALAQFDAHRADEALGTLQPLLDAPTAHPDALALAADIRESKNDTGEAVALLRKALLADPTNVGIYMQFATLSFDHASPQVGIDIVSAGIGKMPMEPRLYLVRGILLAQKGEFGRAVEDFDAADRLDPRLQFLAVAEGLVHSQEHKPEEALAHFRAAVKTHPNDAYGYYLLAEALAAEGKPEGSAEYNEEIDAAKKAVKLDPGLVAARDLLSAAYYANGHLEQVIEQSRAALTTNPNDESAVYHLMLALRKAGRTEEAHAALEQLMTLRANSRVNEAPVRRYHLYEETPLSGANLNHHGNQ
jgi:tetratricopeptide (TPR) repeat protein